MTGRAIPHFVIASSSISPVDVWYLRGGEDDDHDHDHDDDDDDDDGVGGDGVGGGGGDDDDDDILSPRRKTSDSK